MTQREAEIAARKLAQSLGHSLSRWRNSHYRVNDRLAECRNCQRQVILQYPKWLAHGPAVEVKCDASTEKGKADV